MAIVYTLCLGVMTPGRDVQRTALHGRSHATHALDSCLCPPLEPLAGSVERVTLHREETGFCVLRVKGRGHRALVTVVGTAPTIPPGADIESAGCGGTDPTPGLQCTTTQLRGGPPTTLEGLERYVGAGMVKGMGPHCARTLGQACGAEGCEGSAQTPHRWQELDGIGPKRTARVGAAWAAPQGMRDSMGLVHSPGVGTARAGRI